MYVSKRMFSLGTIIILLTVLLGSVGVQAAPNITSAPFRKGVISAAELNVRNGPATTYAKVCMLKKGDTVTILGKCGEWYAVYCKDGRVGFAMGTFIKKEGTKLPNIPNPQTPSKPVATTKPSTGSNSNTNNGVTLSTDEKDLLNLVNAERTKAGIAALKADAGLMKVARLKAQDMVNNNYFSHQSPTYGSPFDMMKRFGVTYKLAGENIAGNSTVSGAVKAWMNSSGHRANILNGKFNYTGIGVVKSPKYGKMLVQQFIQK